MLTLPRRKILKKKSAVQRVYQKGTSYVNRYLVLYVFALSSERKRFVEYGDKSVSLEKKVAFAAGKKLGNAVVRNRLKRIMRESYRLEQKNIADGYWLLFVARKAAADVKQPIIGKAFVQLAKKAGIFSDSSKRK